jgi:hypothetical protein
MCPLADIGGAIRPGLLAVTVALISKPGTLVGRFVLEDKSFAFFYGQTHGLFSEMVVVKNHHLLLLVKRRHLQLFFIDCKGVTALFLSVLIDHLRHTLNVVTLEPLVKFLLRNHLSSLAF